MTLFVNLRSRQLILARDKRWFAVLGELTQVRRTRRVAALDGLGNFRAAVVGRSGGWTEAVHLVRMVADHILVVLIESTILSVTQTHVAEKNEGTPLAELSHASEHWKALEKNDSLPCRIPFYIPPMTV